MKSCLSFRSYFHNLNQGQVSTGVSSSWPSNNLYFLYFWNLHTTQNAFIYRTEIRDVIPEIQTVCRGSEAGGQGRSVQR